MSTVSNSIEFKVPTEGDQYLSVIIGVGQLGHTSFQNMDGKFYSGNITSVKIGDRDSLIGKSLNINSMITDVNPYTNMTSISYYINNKIIHKQEPFTKEVSQDNASVYFLTNIKFK